MKDSQLSLWEPVAVANLFMQLQGRTSIVANGHSDPWINILESYGDPARFYEHLIKGRIFGFNLVDTEDGLTIEHCVDGIWIPAPIEPEPYFCMTFKY